MDVLRSALDRFGRHAPVGLAADGEIPKAEKKLRKIEQETGKRPEGRLPDFLLLGAQKCGTAYLFKRLSRHPDVEPPVIKEVDFFSKHFGWGVGWYRSCFPARSDGQPSWSWEASPNNLFYPHAARRAAEVVPAAKLIALLRNPVDRAYSHYHHQVRMGHETLPSFEAALEAEEERLRGKREEMLRDEGYLPLEFPRFSYRARGIYADQIEEWRRHFDDEQLLVVKSEDLYESPRETITGIVRFLGLPEWNPENARLSRAKTPRYSYGPMDPTTRKQLEEYFEPHNRRLYGYLGRDFGW